MHPLLPVAPLLLAAVAVVWGVYHLSGGRRMARDVDGALGFVLFSGVGLSPLAVVWTYLNELPGSVDATPKVLAITLALGAFVTAIYAVSGRNAQTDPSVTIYLIALPFNVSVVCALAYLLLRWWL